MGVSVIVGVGVIVIVSQRCTGGREIEYQKPGAPFFVFDTPGLFLRSYFVVQESVRPTANTGRPRLRPRARSRQRPTPRSTPLEYLHDSFCQKRISLEE